MPRRQAGNETRRGEDQSGIAPEKRRKTAATLSALALLVLGFVITYELFLKSLAPGGVVDFSPPSGNFTGTTTISTAYGYMCAASHITDAQTAFVNSTSTTLTGIGMSCYPEFYGDLQIPFGSEIIVVWLVTLAVIVALVFYLFRWSPTDITKPF